MKTTYLVYQQVNGVRQLAAATQAEWDAILRENKRLPLEERRRFTRDCIEDGDELDCIYIEVSASEHREWNSKNTMYQRNRKIGMRYTHMSLDAGVPDTDIESLHDSIRSDYNLEDLVTDQVLIEELRQALQAWKPWGEELLELYLSGEKRSCTNRLCETYQVSDRTIQRWKEAFEKFILNFLKNNVGLSS